MSSWSIVTAQGSTGLTLVGGMSNLSWTKVSNCPNAVLLWVWAWAALSRAVKACCPNAAVALSAVESVFIG